MSARVVIVDSLRGEYLREPDIEREVLGEGVEVELLRVERSEQLHGEVDDAEVLVSWHHIDVDEALIERLRRCRGIVRAGVGYDNIDVRAAHRHDIPVCNVPDYGSEEVADHTWALLLGLVRKLVRLDRHCRAGGWDWRTIGPTLRLRGRRLGIVGFGRIGCAVARRAAAFGLEVGFYDPYRASGVDKALGVRRYEQLPELLEASDIVTLHVTLGEETRGLIDAEAFARMGPETFVINTSRGEVIDRHAMLEALERDQVAGLGLDVIPGEPRVPERLRVDERVLMTAHAAFYSDAGLRELRVKTANAAADLIARRPVRDLIDPQTLQESLR